MKILETFLTGFFLTVFFMFGLFALYVLGTATKEEFSSKPIGITCGVVTPTGIAPTFSADKVKGIRVSDFGVIHSRDFIYTPASGEVCVFIYKED